MKRGSLLLAALFVVAPLARPITRAQEIVADPSPRLVPTNHPRVPSDLSQLWLAPTHTAPAGSHAEFLEGVKLEVDGNFAKALPIFSKPALQEGTLGDYGLYYKGLAEPRLNHADDARPGLPR